MRVRDAAKAGAGGGGGGGGGRPVASQGLGLGLALAFLGAAACLVPTVRAGFACLSNPCFYGICVDDLNSSYTCYCIDGYTGAQCQTNWDECWSSPCRHGGTCSDGVAAFNCSCPQGYSGAECEEDTDECGSNPCLNNATCEDAVNGYSCHCLPGYSGEQCEVDEAVCNATGLARCANGGSCREGPGDAFSCLCADGWSGPLCEEPVDECASSPCSNGGVCVDLVAGFACACLFGFTGRACERRLERCAEGESPCANGALCLQEGDRAVCYCVPDFHGARCHLQYDECQLGPRCLNGGTCLDGVDNFTCSCPPLLTGQFCECLVLATGQLDCSYQGPPPPAPSTTSTTPTTPSTTDAPTTPAQPQPATSGSTADASTDHTTPQDEETSTSTEETTSYFSRFPVTSTSFAPDFSSSSSSSVSGSESTYRESSTIHTSPETISITSYSSSSSSSFSTESSPPDSTTTEILDTSSFLWEYSPSAPVTTRRSPFTTITAEETGMTATERSGLPGAVTTVGSSDGAATDTGWTAVEEETTEGFSTSMLTEMTWSTSDEATATATATAVATTETADCSVQPCLNGGTCVYGTDGLRCACAAGWEGRRCEEAGAGAAEAGAAGAFRDGAWLRHRLPSARSASVQVTARSLAPQGLILLAQLSPNRYFALWVREGRLHFRFSCGKQTMRFAETQTRVDDGRDLHLHATLTEGVSGNGSLQCLGSLRVNAALAMGGEQVAAAAAAAAVPAAPVAPAWLLLGALPPGWQPPWPPSDPDAALPHFTGCMHGLKVDEARRRLVEDAAAAGAVGGGGECAALACMSSPCGAAGTCVPHGRAWTCLCPPGFVGRACERWVCLNNPCLFGATCAPFPGSGFVCLCPLGKHGLLCEHDLEVAQPWFAGGGGGGLSSFVAYTLPAPLHHSLELRFRFRPAAHDQVALLAFVGQDGPHDAHSDHLAVSFIKGYVVLTWNLGSGPRRIFTPRAVSEGLGRPGRPHLVRVGRSGRDAWLLVDNLGNVSGRAPGRLSQLNTRSMLYLGGHSSANLSLLPHDLPLHGGFAGCLFDVELRAGRSSVALGRTRAAAGRAVAQCGTSECHPHACLNGGACLPHGSSYTCLCAAGWWGPVCGQRSNPCDEGQQACAAGATCVPLPQGHACDCPPGRAGRRCEREEALTDVLLSGQRSYLALEVPSGDGPGPGPAPCLQLQLELRPLSERGLVAFMGSLRDQHSPSQPEFFSLALHGGVLELRVAPGVAAGSGAWARGAAWEPAVVRSGRVLATGRWHRVVAGRYGRRLYLRVDGALSSALLPARTPTPSPAPADASLLYIGGVDDLSRLPLGASAGPAASLRGCVRAVAVDGRRVVLTAAAGGAVRGGRNVEDCDGTPCGGDACLHGGSCRLSHNGTRAECLCAPHYGGARCESARACGEAAAGAGAGAGAESCGGRGRGRCVDGRRCVCALGWTGRFCETAVRVTAAEFAGDGFLVARPPQPLQLSASPSPQLSPQLLLDQLFVNFSTAQPHGLLLWASGGEAAAGVGLSDGRLQLGWRGGGGEAGAAAVPGAAGAVADGAWHAVATRLTPRAIELWVDGRLALARAPPPPPFLARHHDLYVGGLPPERDVSAATGGLFSGGFSGCVSGVALANDSLLSADTGAGADADAFEGENVGACHFALP